MCLPEAEYFPAADLPSPLRISIWKGYQWNLQMKDKEISWKSVCVWKPHSLCAGQSSPHPWSEANARKQSSTGLLNCWGWKKTEIDRLSSICCCIAIFLHLPGAAAFHQVPFVSEKNNFCSYSSKVVLWNTFVWVENITHIWWKTKWEKKNCNFLKNMAGGSTIMIWQLIFSPGHVFIWDQDTKNERED